jgi:hypothetical protein
LKKLILILIFLLAGCATTDLENRIKVLEDRAARVEMMTLSGSAAANFFPSRDVDWEETGEAGGDLDFIPSTANLDISYLMSLAEANYAKCASTMCNTTLTFFSPYILEDAADSEDFPWQIAADDGGNEFWELMDGQFNRIFGKTDVIKDTATPITVNSWNTGAYFINDDDDDIVYNLPADPTDLFFCFGNDRDASSSTTNIQVDPDASDYIIIHGAIAGQGELIETHTGSAKDVVCLIGLDSSYWKVVSYQGVWKEDDV